MSPPETAAQKLRELFRQQNLNLEAFSDLEYVGTRTGNTQNTGSSAGATDFRALRETVAQHLRQNRFRMPRPLPVILQMLQVLVDALVVTLILALALNLVLALVLGVEVPMPFRGMTTPTTHAGVVAGRMGVNQPCCPPCFSLFFLF